MADVIDKDRGWKKLRRELEKAADSPYAKVGVLQSHGAGEAHDDNSSFTMVALAATHEFGAPKAGIPPRPFISRTFDERESALNEIREKCAKGIYSQKLAMENALRILGEWGAAQVKDFIVKGEVTPPVSPGRLRQKTIGGKKGTTTLVDTGRLMNALSYEVAK